MPELETTRQWNPFDGFEDDDKKLASIRKQYERAKLKAKEVEEDLASNIVAFKAEAELLLDEHTHWEKRANALRRKFGLDEDSWNIKDSRLALSDADRLFMLMDDRPRIAKTSVENLAALVRFHELKHTIPGGADEMLVWYAYVGGRFSHGRAGRVCDECVKPKRHKDLPLPDEYVCWTVREKGSVIEHHFLFQDGPAHTGLVSHIALQKNGCPILQPTFWELGSAEESRLEGWPLTRTRDECFKAWINQSTGHRVF